MKRPTIAVAIFSSVSLTTLLLFGCGQKAAEPSWKTKNTSVPEIPKLSAAEMSAIVADATKDLNAERDKMEGITFYNTQAMTIPLSERIGTYISVTDSGHAFLRVYIRYYGNDWIFFDKVKVMTDDAVVYDRIFEHSEVTRNNSGGSVWETADFLAQPNDIKALRLIAAGKQSLIRLDGDANRDDHDLTPHEIKSIGRILSAFDRLVKLQPIDIAKT